MSDPVTDCTAIALASRSLLAAGADLTAVAKQIAPQTSARWLRQAILTGARTDEFAGAIISGTPPELVPAVRQLLRAWPDTAADERTELRRLRRALVAVKQMRSCYCAAMDACTEGAP